VIVAHGHALPAELEVVIEVPLGGFIKRRDDGGIDFVSLAPCPFKYGSVPDTRSGDGDRLDALVLGPRLARGTRVRAEEYPGGRPGRPPRNPPEIGASL
jgi:inorganic pyrophosphatase